MTINDRTEGENKTENGEILPRTEAYAKAIESSIFMALKVIGRDLNEEQLYWQAFEGGAHIAWLTGHLLLAFDGILLQAVGGQESQIPPAWHVCFGMGQKPTSNSADYPPHKEVRTKLKELGKASVALVRSLSDSRLSEPLPEGPPPISNFKIVEVALIMSSNHTSYHCGQISFLRRLQGLPGPLGL